ncbi:hypothetical protein [Streptococcus mutans]|uniref:hypothetical protein n=1 Tax=Streptococcus mutans TaxID=1309 RepID=UPI00159E35B2|nr:hypothetical protein [Streptococcus mutans]
MSSVLLSNFCFTSSQTALARLTGISPLHGFSCSRTHGNHLADDDSWNTGINRSLSFLTGHGAPVPSARFLSQRI